MRWLALPSAGSRLLPAFLIIGAKRSGSSSLYDYVVQHPDVLPNLSGKGTHYFDVHFHRGWRRYRSSFPAARGTGAAITGEASPYYLFHPLAPGRIAAALPEVRLVAVLRDPVARAWSQWRYERQRGFEDLDFEAALDAEPARLAGEAQRIARDPRATSHAHRHHSYLARGHYAEQLQAFLAHFPAEHLMVLQSEALFADPQAELGRVWAFLGLGPARLTDVRPRKAGAAGADGDRSMPEGSRDRLDQYYRPHNEALYRLGVVGFRWPPSPTRTEARGNTE